MTVYENEFTLLKQCSEDLSKINEGLRADSEGNFHIVGDEFREELDDLLQRILGMKFKIAFLDQIAALVDERDSPEEATDERFQDHQDMFARRIVGEYLKAIDIHLVSEISKDKHSTPFDLDVLRGLQNRINTLNREIAPELFE